jgi:26S proteasome regulatory subunit N5
LKDDSNIFDSSDFGVKRWKTFKDRVVEHNIRIMAKYYTRVSLTRMSELLDLKQEEVELFLCNMITTGTVIGRIDRPSGIVSFLKTKDPSEALNEWANNLDKLMGLISNATHLINKEEMVHRHLAGAPGTSTGPSPSTSTTAVANQ